MSHLLKKVLDAGDTYNGSLESRPLFIQADPLGERASSILRELEAGQQMLETRIPLLAASGFVGAVATLSMVGAEIDPSVAGGSRGEMHSCANRARCRSNGKLSCCWHQESNDESNDVLNHYMTRGLNGEVTNSFDND